MKPFLALIIFILMTLLPVAAALATDELRILSSDRITPPDLVERFEREEGIRVRFEYFESPEALAAYLEARPRGDMALLRGYYVPQLANKDQLAPLNHQLLPNLKHLVSGELNTTSDPDRRYSVPYLMGTLGIIYRAELLAGQGVPGWDWIFERFAGSASFAITNQYRDAMGAALIHLGYSYNSTSPVAIGQAAELLRGLAEHPAFLGFLDPATTLKFLNEKFIYAAITYNNLAAEAMEDDPGLAFRVPEGGAVFWSYVYVINKQSSQAKAAHKWLNFLMEPEVAARVSTWNRATSPNLAARALMPPAIGDNPVLYPPASVWRNAEPARAVDPETEKLFIKFWSQIKMK